MKSPTLMEARGSLLRCLLLTGQPRHETAKTLTDMTDGNALVTQSDTWMPEGILKPDEAKVHEKFPLITLLQRKQLMNWWLHTKSGANTPNWDIVSACTIENKPGLLLVEAKAHTGELSSAGKQLGNLENHSQIGRAIAEANAQLNKTLSGWNLQRDKRYQLANRFAWAWKFADRGIPVVLVYLGFRNAEEMGAGAFAAHTDWRACVLAHTASVVPVNAWGRRLDIGGVPLFPLIRSLEIRFQS